MDNKILRVSGETAARLKVVMGLAHQQSVAGYHADANQITFFWTDHEKATPFPTALSVDRAAEIAFDWLQGRADYGKQPDHDGDNKKGWLCFCDGWGHIDDFGWQAFVAVRPLWAMYGK
jgi:hypothetical protein